MTQGGSVPGGGSLLPDPGVIRTVLGDVPADGFGRVDYHEHLFQVSPLLPGDDLDDEGRSSAELRSLSISGFEAMVDATPVGLGRRPSALARLSSETGVAVVATTGRHRDAHYSDQRWVHDVSAETWSSIFVRELTVGTAETDPSYAAAGSDRRLLDAVVLAETETGAPVRAGMLKAGIDYWRITAGEHAALEAVARAHSRTGAPIMVHTEACSAALEVIELLAALGVAAHRIVIAHADRTLDPGLHSDIAATGALLGYDGAGRLRDGPDQARIDSLAIVVERGFSRSVLLGADVARSSRYESYGGMPGLGYLGTRFVPRLVDRLGEQVVRDILVGNPARFLSWQH